MSFFNWNTDKCLPKRVFLSTVCHLKVTRKAAVASSFCCSHRFNYLTFLSSGSSAACQWQTLISVTFSSIIRTPSVLPSFSHHITSIAPNITLYYFSINLRCWCTLLGSALRLCFFNTCVYFASLPLPSCSYSYLLFHAPHSCLLLFPVNLPMSCYLSALQFTVKP